MAGRVDGDGIERTRRALAGHTVGTVSVERRPLVFPNTLGKPLDPGTATKAFYAALEAAELPRIRVHDLRQTAASYLLSLDVHPKVVQEMLGHSTVTLTMNSYSHVLPALHKEVAGHMDRLFRNRQSAS